MIALRVTTCRSAARVIRIGQWLLVTTVSCTLGALSMAAYIHWIVAPALVAEAELREAKFAIRAARHCGKHMDLARQADGIWRCVPHNFQP